MKYKTNKTKPTEKESSKILLKPLFVLQYKIHREIISLPVLPKFGSVVWDATWVHQLQVSSRWHHWAALGRCVILPFGF